MPNLKFKIKKWLRLLDPYLKTDTVYLAKGGSWLTFGQLISTAATFGIAIAFANLLPKEVYGTYKFVISTAGILGIFTLPRMLTAVTQAVARNLEGTVQAGMAARLRWGTLTALGGLGAGIYYLVQGDTTLAFAMLIVALFVPFMNAFGTYEGIVLGTKRFGIASRLGIYEKLGYTLAMLAVLFLTKNIFLVLLAYFVPYTLLRGLFYLYTTRKFQKNKKVDSRAVSYGRHLSAVGAIAIVASNLENILLFHYLDAVAVAVYSFAIAPVEQLKGLLRPLGALALPKFAQRDLKSILSRLPHKFMLLTAAGLIIFGVYVIFAPLIFQIFFPKYLDAVLFSQIFAGTIVLRLPLTLAGALGESQITSVPKKFIYLSALPAFVQLVALLALVQLGIIGVIASRYMLLVTTIVYGLAMRQIFKKRHKQREQNKNS